MLRIPRLLTICLICAFILIVPTFVSLHNSHSSAKDILHRSLFSAGRMHEELVLETGAGKEVLGGVVMGKLANETAKAELGRATWKFLHTMTQRYPEKPTQDERDALKSFIYLFSRLYPCGECAAHFQSMLKEYPPQTSSRNSASLYMCSLHNRVNERLKKPEFDCTTLAENYDCGCGEEKPEGRDMEKSGITASEEAVLKKDPVTGQGLVEG